MVYVGDTRSRKLLRELSAMGCGTMVVRGRMSGARLPRWAYDNGAFVDWKAGRDFNEGAFLSDLARFDPDDLPDFVVLPDRVASGSGSLLFSMQWIARIRGEGLVPDSVPLYLAVQDGMTVDGIPWGEVDGVFLGGTNGWKRRHARDWAQASMDHDIPFHYARCGTAPKVSQAIAVRADSIDSCLPLWSRGNFGAFKRALSQVPMFFEVS